MAHSLIIGAGIGGLTTAALLLQAGHRVTVLEAHVYPGGCAGTFFHKGFRFDAGATLAGGFAPGGPHARLADLLELTWPVSPVDPAWVVHLPDGRTLTQWADPAHWRAERQAVFPQAESFWRTQEKLAAIAWDVSSRPFPWPPQSVTDIPTLARAMRPQTALALPHLWRTIGQIAPLEDPLFRAFLDAQLLISAQTTSQDAHALYGSAALDLPRRGVNHVQGGMGALAETLVVWIRQHGGEVHFRQQVAQITVEKGRATAVTTRKGLHLAADHIIANVTPWALRHLLAEAAPPALAQETQNLPPTWGAFTLYLGLDERYLPPGIVTHHQVIVDHTRPLGEGNSVFISLSEPGDTSRAPEGMRAATLSTHTAVTPWQQLRQADSPAPYCERREEYMNRLLVAAERAIPGIRRAVRLSLPGTPVTFAFYTRRPLGMVGGFPQTSLFQARGPAAGIPHLWLVGDSIFPGQSTAGVTLGGMRVATAVLQSA
ncbi:MAG: FAD-dependent oxidoreductase [Anaerolineae bacterium]|nr:FAD-dependent oxidoreductase [Anaerolineae bacterium]